MRLKKKDILIVGFRNGSKCSEVWKRITAIETAGFMCLRVIYYIYRRNKEKQ